MKKVLPIKLQSSVIMRFITEAFALSFVMAVRDF
jgi:hypothetical protein